MHVESNLSQQFTFQGLVVIHFALSKVGLKLDNHGFGKLGIRVFKRLRSRDSSILLLYFSVEQLRIGEDALDRVTQYVWYERDEIAARMLVLAKCAIKSEHFVSCLGASSFNKEIIFFVFLFVYKYSKMNTTQSYSILLAAFVNLIYFYHGFFLP